jgi:hypothetical protein
VTRRVKTLHVDASSRWRKESRAFVELFALCGFAIAQPLLDLFGRNPTQFVFRNADTPDIIVFALLVACVPPLILWIVDFSHREQRCDSARSLPEPRWYRGPVDVVPECHRGE